MKSFEEGTVLTLTRTNSSRELEEVECPKKVTVKEVKMKTENKPFKDLEECAPSQGDGNCKVPEGEGSVICLRNSEKRGIAGVKSKKELGSESYRTVESLG